MKNPDIVTRMYTLHELLETAFHTDPAEGNKAQFIDSAYLISLGIVEALGAILDNPTRYTALQEAIKEGSEE